MGSRWPTAWCLLGCLVALAMLYARGASCTLEVSHCVDTDHTQVYEGTLRNRDGSLIADQRVAIEFPSLGNRRYLFTSTDTGGRYCFVWYPDGPLEVVEPGSAAPQHYQRLLRPDTRPPTGCPRNRTQPPWSNRQNVAGSWHVQVPLWVALAGILAALAALLRPVAPVQRLGYLLTAVALLGAVFALGG